MATYSMAYRDVMDLPMRVFWHLSGSVERLRKDQARLQLEVLASAQHHESALQMREHLDSVAPDPVTFNKAAIAINEQLDRDGLEMLRSMI